ncbi:hypothetical protein [Herbiconiux sp. YIM B11900]|uniref:hypothetical protein n=1 Tax=Herbiconiux sp. YIM B11900 TaxID=3404131 RepID=UPI003F878C1A
MTVTQSVNNRWKAVSQPAFSRGFNLERLAGWKPGSVGVRGESIEVEEGHGEYDLPVYRGRRIIESSGYVVAANNAERNRMSDRFSGVLADGSLGRVTIEDEGERRWARVRLQSASFEDTYPARADWELALRAPDPRIFGDLEEYTGGIVDVINRGSFPSSPVIKVSGAGTNTYGVYGPSGRRWLVEQDLVSGHPHYLNIETGELIIDNVLFIGQTPEADSWVCPPGVRTRHTIDPNGNNAVMTVLNRNTWI